MRPALEGPESRLNVICPYYTMFPLSFPLSQLQGARKGEWVLDPFCGRGTTNYAARLLGLPSIGVDSNPVAAAIAEAKMVGPSAKQVLRACREILSSASEPKEIPSREFWRRCYASKTLRDLCVIREALLDDCRSASRKGLRALILGCLHGPLTKGKPSYLSNQMPRTYAAKPAYAIAFWCARSMAPPKVNVINLVARRADHYFGSVPAEVDGHVTCEDSRTVKIETGRRRIRWVITSPPYYGMRTYIPDQWLRYWFLGGAPEVTYSAEGQLRHQSPEVFVEELGEVWSNVARACAEGARMVIRFGGIRDRRQDPRDLLRESIVKADCGWKLMTAKSAGLATAGRRQASQFKTGITTPVEEYDFYARLTE